jgi:Patatin-like phospholipase
MSQPQSLNVLAIDGGGVRGLSSLLILKRVMEQLQRTVGLKSALLPCQIFHVICGTSTGGLIAIMLGRLRMRVDDAIEHYRVLCKAVFGSPKLFRGLRSAIGVPIYSASTLEKCIKSITAKSDAAGHNEDAPLNDPLTRSQDGGHCHTFVVAISQAQADAPAQLFRSYSSEITSSVDACTIWESARATTAMSKFFRPVKVGMPPITYLVRTIYQTPRCSLIKPTLQGR